MVINTNFSDDKSSSEKNLTICVVEEEQTGKSTFIREDNEISFEVSEYVSNRTTESLIYAAAT